MTDLDLVLINFRTPDLVMRFVASLREYTPEDLDVHLIVVDNDPEPFEGLIDDDLRVDGVRTSLVTSRRNLGYNVGCNVGAALGNGRIIALLNSDVRLLNDECLPRMVDFLDADPRAAVAGPLQIDDLGRATHAGIFGTQSDPQHRAFLQPVTDEHRDIRPAVTVSGSAYFIKRSAWTVLTSCPLYQDVAPGAPGAYLPAQHYYSDTWCSYHASAHGMGVWYVGDAEIEHLWHKSSPVNGEMDRGPVFDADRSLFRRACDHHRIPRD